MKRSNWSKAIVLSCILHGILLVGMGWVFSKSAVTEPQYVEIELLAGYDGGSRSEVVSGAVGTWEQSVESINVSDEVVSMVIPEIGTMPMQTSSGISSRGETVSTGQESKPVSGGAVAGRKSLVKVVPPVIIKEVEADYPEQTRRDGIEGITRLRIQVLENGSTGHISVAASSGSELLDQAAIAAARQWIFIPAKEADTGRPVGCYITRPVAFRLK